MVKEDVSTLPIFISLPLAASLGWFMCLYINAPPRYYVVYRPFGISKGVYFCMSARVPTDIKLLSRAMCICELLFSTLPPLLYSFPRAQG